MTRGAWTWERGGGRALFTTRGDGNIAVHVPHDADEVRAARGRVASELGLAPDRVAAVHQVHGADVWLDLGIGDALPADVRWDRGDGSPIEADALVSARPGIALAVAVADCMPIAVVWGEAVAAIHAGWRSLEAGVIEATLAAMRRAAGSSVAFADAGPYAVIGPCLGSCCLEVGEDVAERFPDASVIRRVGAPRPFLDARADARRRLEAVGAGVDVIDVCTRCDERLFSHRGDGGATGRQAVLVTRV